MKTDTIIIDGYNLIKLNLQHFPENLSLEQQREHLLRLLHSSSLSRNHRILVVFDGSQPVLPGNRFRYRGIQVLFSGSGKTADDRIRQYILNSPQPESIEVVTSDREIQHTARNLGCQIISSSDFWKRLTRSPEPEKRSREVGESDRELSDREVKEWLNLFQQRGADDED